MKDGFKPKNSARILSKSTAKFRRVVQKEYCPYFGSNKNTPKLLKTADKKDSVGYSEKRRISLLKLPKEEEIDQMLDELNIFTAKKTNTKKITLQEKLPVTFKIEKYSSQFLKVYCKGKKPPLSIKLDRIEGRVQAYVSKSIEEPSDLFHDQIYTSEEFDITNFNNRFGCEWIYLAVYAIETSQISISCYFNSVAFLSRKSSMEDKKLSNNFLYRSSRSSFCVPKSNRKERKNQDGIISWQSESKNLSNFSEIFSKYSIVTETSVSKSVQKHLIKTMYILKFLHSIMKLKPKKNTTNRFLGRKSFNLTKSSFEGFSSNLQIQRSKTDNVRKVRNKKSPSIYDTKQIILIQNKWREYHKRQTELWDKLIFQWHVCIGRLLESNDISNEQKKSYLQINPEKRNKLLKQIIHEQKQDFLLKSRRGSPTALTSPSDQEILRLINILIK